MSFGKAQRYQRVLPYIDTYGTLLQEQELPILIAQGRRGSPSSVQ